MARRPVTRWDDDPPPDQLAVRFVVNGTPMRLDTVAEENQALRMMAARGTSLDEAARRLHMTRAAAEARARRATPPIEFPSEQEPAHWTLAYWDSRKSVRRRRVQ